MADALSRKSYCNNLMLQQGQPLLHEELCKLNLHIAPHGFLSTLVEKPTLEDQIITDQKLIRVLSASREKLRRELVDVSLWMIEVLFCLIIAWWFPRINICDN